MTSAKEIRIDPIEKRDADALVKRIHYSGKYVRNSSLSLGVFLNGRLEGAMQFGSSLDKSNVIGLVRDTGWNDFLELNRMAFSDLLPRNSESRALGIALRMIRKNYPHIEWVVSFADACQCGDGAIYRAAGFVLTKIRVNKDVLRFADGTIGHKMAQVTGKNRREHFARNGGLWSGSGEAIPGFMLRYMYFLNPAARARLTVPEVPFSEIDARGAGMYKGRPIVRGKQAAAGSNPNGGVAATTPTLQRDEAGG